MTSEQMIAALRASGWQQYRSYRHIWTSPSGGLFYGPAFACYVSMNFNPVYKLISL